MKLTKKDFEALAKCIKIDGTKEQKDIRDLIAYRLAQDVLPKSNELFDKEKFLEACGVETVWDTMDKEFPNGFIK